jgi:hypothetical protein
MPRHFALLLPCHYAIIAAFADFHYAIIDDIHDYADADSFSPAADAISMADYFIDDDSFAITPFADDAAFMPMPP